METNIKFDVTISTDGSCKNNPGIGGYCALLRYTTKKDGKEVSYEKEVYGSSDYTSNNKMELQAAISGVDALKAPCNITLRSDSKYVLETFQQLDELEKNDWKRGKAKRRIPNYEMWKEMNRIRKLHNFTLIKVDGHSGDPDNERCDKVAKRCVKEREAQLLQELKSTGISLHQYIMKAGMQNGL